MHSALKWTKFLFPHLNVPTVNTGIITKFTNFQRLCSFSPLHPLWQRAYGGFRGSEVSRCYSRPAPHEVQKLAGPLALCPVCYHRLTNPVLLEMVVSNWRLLVLSDSLLPSVSWHPNDSAHGLPGYRHGLGPPPAPRPLPQHLSGSLEPFCSAGACQRDLFFSAQCQFNKLLSHPLFPKLVAALVPQWDLHARRRQGSSAATMSPWQAVGQSISGHEHLPFIVNSYGLHAIYNLKI